jgi:arylformamidase
VHEPRTEYRPADVGLSWETDRIDAEYDPERRAGSRVPYVQWYAARSEAARQELNSALDVPFGATPDETFDVFPSSRTDSPILIFIHGGYWRALGSKDFSFVAQGLVPHDVTVVVTNYSLCPRVSMDVITAQSQAAVREVSRSAASFNGNPSRLFVAGHSAGAQQVGMLLSMDRRDGGREPLPLSGGIAISGVFDVRPLLRSWLQPTLRLTDDLAVEQSPVLQIPAQAAPLLLSVGGAESAAFHAQTDNYYRTWMAAGHRVEQFAQPQANHFETVCGLGDPGSPLVRAVRQFMHGC